MYEGVCVICEEYTREGYGRLGEFTYCPLHVCRSSNPIAMRGQWTGPVEGDQEADGSLIRPVPPERWPWGPPAAHEGSCLLFNNGLRCDCAASDTSDEDYGVVS